MSRKGYWKLVYRHWLSPMLDRRQWQRMNKLYQGFYDQWKQYEKHPGAESVAFDDLHPCLHDRMDYTPFDGHYTYQSVWAAQAIRDAGAAEHVDVGSLVLFVGMLTAMTRVISVDIRPLSLDVANFEGRAGSLTALPFEDRSVASLSCLHVVEHVGLGRYGDPLDPAGTRKSCAELARVLAPGGQLYVSMPVGRPRVCFNAHRVHAPATVLDYFESLQLEEFSVVDDEQRFLRNVRCEDYAAADYACGLFRFTRS